MKIAITGSSGFIGTHLCAALSDGHDIVPLSRDNIGDFHEVEDWSAIFAGCDAVIHLAARVHQTNERTQNAEEYARDNTELTRRIVDGAMAAGAAQFIFLSTAAVYGDAQVAKAEDAALAPSNEYGRSKLAAEDIVNIARDKMRSVIIRPPLIYGRNCRANFMMLSKAIAKGLPLPLSGVKNQRSFLYIGNLCSFIAHALKTEAVQGAYNLADDTALSTPDMVRAMAAAMGKKPRLFWFPPILLRYGFSLIGYRRQITGLTGSFILDINKVQNTEWRAPYTTEQGLRETLKE